MSALPIRYLKERAALLGALPASERAPWSMERSLEQACARGAGLCQALQDGISGGRTLQTLQRRHRMRILQ